MIKKNYIALLNIKGLTTSEKIILLVLIDENETNNYSNEIVALIDYLSLCVGLSKRTVIRAIKELKKKGYITSKKMCYNYDKHSRTNVYSINYALLNEQLGMNNIKEVDF